MKSLDLLKQQITTEVQKNIIGQDEAIELILVGLLTGGHLLLEDVPGVGKTMLARSLANTLNCDFARVQCTPDLLPSDVIGTTIYNQKEQSFQFRAGPIFHSIILVDEINRTTPRTQSALLECMAERQVTVDGKSYPLPQPFIVIATQNPIESQGTFPLPEAQLDRFLMKISLGYPKMEEEVEILRLHRQSNKQRSEARSIISVEEVIQAQQIVNQVQIDPDLELYLVHLVRTTRNHPKIKLGVSPRGLIALSTASQALAALRGRDYVTPDDIKYLAPKVLAHRIVLSSSLYTEKVSAEEIIQQICEESLIPVENEVES